jgi:hypothetical protein
MSECEEAKNRPNAERLALFIRHIRFGRRIEAAGRVSWQNQGLGSDPEAPSISGTMSLKGNFEIALDIDQATLPVQSRLLHSFTSSSVARSVGWLAS